ncbi:hypothetical protein TRFO_10929 [Tritrichomonas foetus]|uniref:C2 NT-type domain-containing protein n=1 Tax=Tritrichomonas foetus TaxID=1144522 RepID=A0A1J4J6C8_9EUKA|nr:hypothetical protein TRFO_10929 [Tritrichomonas foetus]|eukprot:OHS94760.1 hypothetical protein TRFO_10929 [Tritrichomonas foetus]
MKSALKISHQKHKMKKGKQAGLVIFTIHSLIIPHNNSDIYQIEWKRGDNKGYTEKLIPQDSAVLFEKRFRCNATFYISSDLKARPKILTIKALRFDASNNKPKIIGKLYLDITIFLPASGPLTSTFTLDSPHKKKPTINMTTEVKIMDSMAAIKSSLATDPSFSSLSEATSLTEDHESEWDLSSAASDETNEMIKSFFNEQHQKKEKYDLDLKNFMREHAKKNVRKAALKSPPVKKRDRAFSDSENDGKMLNAFFASQEKRSKNRSKFSGVFLTYQTALNLTKFVLSYSWCQSPVFKTNEFPKPASAIYASLIHTQLLNSSAMSDSYFEPISDVFFKILNEKKVVQNGTIQDNFIVLVHLIALLNIPRHFDINRLTFFNTKLYELAQQSFLELIENFIENFEEFFAEISKMDFDVEKVIQIFSKELQQINQITDFPKYFIDYLIKHLICSIDSKLVDSMIQNPIFCTFSNAMRWNSLITMMTNELKVDFPMFKQANSVIMMSQGICNEPQLCEEVAYNLPKNAILKILKNQAPDEFIFQANNTLNFIDYYLDDCKTECNCFNAPNFEGLGEMVSLINTSQWKFIKFSDQDLSNFSFLKEIFYPLNV